MNSWCKQLKSDRISNITKGRYRETEIKKSSYWDFESLIIIFFLLPLLSSRALRDLKEYNGQYYC